MSFSHPGITGSAGKASNSNTLMAVTRCWHLGLSRGTLSASWPLSRPPARGKRALLATRKWTAPLWIRTTSTSQSRQSTIDGATNWWCSSCRFPAFRDLRGSTCGNTLLPNSKKWSTGGASQSTLKVRKSLLFMWWRKGNSNCSGTCASLKRTHGFSSCLATAILIATSWEPSFLRSKTCLWPKR